MPASAANRCDRSQQGLCRREARDDSTAARRDVNPFPPLGREEVPGAAYRARRHVLAWREALEAAGIELAVWRIHRRIGMSGGLFVNALLRGLGPTVPVVTRDEVERAKPDPDLFVAAARRSGCRSRRR
jgi:hypothetical protein